MATKKTKFANSEFGIGYLLPNFTFTPKWKVVSQKKPKVMAKRMFFAKNWFPWQPKDRTCQFKVWCKKMFANPHLLTKFEGSILNSSNIMAKIMFCQEFFVSKLVSMPTKKYKICQF